MDRKRIVAFAAATTVVACSAALAVGANFGLFGLAASARPAAPALPVKEVAASSPTAPDVSAPEVRYVDVPITLAVPKGASVTMPPDVTVPASGDNGAAEAPSVTDASIPASDPAVTTTTQHQSDDDHTATTEDSHSHETESDRDD